MNNSLDPLPTKVVAKVVDTTSSDVKDAVSANKPDTTKAEAPKQSNAYAWLLVASTCLSVALCWMYLTKPVIKVVGLSTDSSGLEGDIDSVINDVLTDTDSSKASANVVDHMSLRPNGASKGLLPSDDGLPGIANQLSAPTIIPTGRSSAKADHLAFSGWEKTNHKVQHVLQADSGNGVVEKILVEVPVFYQSRTMGWSQADISAARGLLQRLMVYEGNIHALKQEGEKMLLEWNELLAKTVPSGSLRADSPSLPYNHSILATEAPLSGSEPLIKLEQ